jgi:hypothetical protein
MNTLLNGKQFSKRLESIEKEKNIWRW